MRYFGNQTSLKNRAVREIQWPQLRVTWRQFVKKTEVKVWKKVNHSLLCDISTFSVMSLNKAGYTTQDAPSTCLKITGDGRTDGRTDTTSYRGATAHLKTERKKLPKKLHDYRISLDERYARIKAIEMLQRFAIHLTTSMKKIWSQRFCLHNGLYKRPQ